MAENSFVSYNLLFRAYSLKSWPGEYKYKIQTFTCSPIFKTAWILTAQMA